QGQQFILQSLFTLMGEHLGCESSQFQSEFENEGSLIGAMRKLMGTNTKTLNELPILSHKFAEKFWSILTWFIDLRHCIPKDKFYLAVSFVMMSLAIVILVSNGS